MFPRLLVAIDNDGNADVTLSFATAVARQSDAAVHLLHVNEHIVGSRGVPLLTDEEATRLLVDAVDGLRLEGIRASGSVRRAPSRQVARCIAAMAAQSSADAIVLGSSRRRGIGRLLAGRVGQRTIAQTMLPVITAPAPLELPANGRLDVADVLQLTRGQRQHLEA